MCIERVEDLLVRDIQNIWRISGLGFAMQARDSDEDGARFLAFKDEAISSGVVGRVDVEKIYTCGLENILLGQRYVLVWCEAGWKTAVRAVDSGAEPGWAFSEVRLCKTGATLAVAAWERKERTGGDAGMCGRILRLDGAAKTWLYGLLGGHRDASHWAIALREVGHVESEISCRFIREVLIAVFLVVHI